jgi:hypothetical protein
MRTCHKCLDNDEGLAIERGTEFWTSPGPDFLIHVGIDGSSPDITTENLKLVGNSNNMKKVNAQHLDSQSICVQIASDDVTTTNQMSLSLEGTLDIEDNPKGAYWKSLILEFHFEGGILKQPIFFSAFISNAMALAQ